MAEPSEDDIELANALLAAWDSGQGISKSELERSAGRERLGGPVVAGGAVISASIGSRGYAAGVTA